MYKPTIGLEVHAELRTDTKMFCDSKNDPNEKIPNVNICPVCMAHPGVLPTINKDAVKHVLRVGLAVGGTIADYSEFDRKNYFYPDIPKAYQLSQYEFPLVSGGELSGVALTRIHLEEDTARSSHTTKSGSSLVDFNRAGVPLMELVTEPVIHSAVEAGKFGRELRLLLRTLGASYANMEKGEMRVEVNISVAKNKGELGTKVEIKNLNSFKSAEKAIDFEIKRQSELLDGGGKVVQETRGWNENKNVSFSQRIKEEAADYRYFPDPDLPKLKLSEVSEFNKKVLLKTLPELPEQKRDRLKSSYNLKEDAVNMYVADEGLLVFFEATIRLFDSVDKEKKTLMSSNYILNNLITLDSKRVRATSKITPSNFAKIISMAHSGDISSNGAVMLLERFVVSDIEEGKSVEQLADEMGLSQQNDESELIQIVHTVISLNKDVASDLKNGKEQALQYLVGQGMKLSNGTANPAKLQELIRNELL